MLAGLLVGHGKFASGILDALVTIAGPRPAIIALDYDGVVSIEEYSREIQSNLLVLGSKAEGVFIFSDLLGGTPFQLSSLLAQSMDQSLVIAGSNLPLLLEFATMQNLPFDYVKSELMKLKSKSIYFME